MTASKAVSPMRWPRPRIVKGRKVRVTLRPTQPSTSLESSVPEDCDYFGKTETERDAGPPLSNEVVDFGAYETDEMSADQPCFVLAETASASPALIRAIDDCARFNGQGFFHNRRENRLAMLVLAYLLLLELVSGGDEAIMLATNRLPPDARARRPSLTKPELIAVQLTAKPENEAQRKLCSDYASVLMVARVKGLSPTDFVGWIEEADIGDCKAKAKRIRAALKAGLSPEIDDELAATSPASTEEPWVQISHGRGQRVGGSYSSSVAEMTLPPVADLIEAGVESGSLPSVLRRVAAVLETAQPGQGASADGDPTPSRTSLLGLQASSVGTPL